MSNATMYVEADATEFLRDLDRATRALSGTSLGAFLSGPVQEYFADRIEERFQEEGDVKSGFWQPLTDTTIEIRRAAGYGDGPINIRSGELEDFVVEQYDVAAGAGMAAIDLPGNPPTATAASKLRVAQFGATDNPAFPSSGGTPARPVLAHDEGDMVMVLGLLQAWLTAAVTTGI